MWIAKLSDGRVVSGSSAAWGDVRDSVIGLSYDHNGTVHRLPDGQPGYFFHNTASADMSGVVRLESRVIGCKLGNGTVVKLRFQQGSGEVVVEIGA